MAKSLFPGSSRSGEKARKKSRPRAKGRRLQDPAEELVRRSRIRARLQDDELPGPERRCDLPRRRDDVAHVGLALGRQRRRHADEDRVRLREPREIRRRREPPGGHRGLQPPAVHVLDVALAPAERVDLRRVDVEAEDREALLDERERQRKADVAQAEDPDGGGVLGETPSKSLDEVRRIVVQHPRLISSRIVPPRVHEEKRGNPRPPGEKIPFLRLPQPPTDGPRYSGPF